jgi:hypothetical protein
MFEEIGGAFAADFELAHVAEVEDSRRRADREMFLDDTAVTKRHFEPAEFSHSGAESAVERMQRGLLDRIHPPV